MIQRRNNLIAELKAVLSGLSTDQVDIFIETFIIPSRFQGFYKNIEYATQKAVELSDKYLDGKFSPYFMVERVNSLVSAGYLDALCQSKNAMVLDEAAKFGSAPRDKLIFNEHWFVRTTVAKLGSVEQQDKLLARILSGVREHEEVVYALIIHGSDSCREKLIDVEDSYARRLIVHFGDNTQRSKLVQDSSPHVRQAVAQKGCFIDCVKLYDDKDALTRSIARKYVDHEVSTELCAYVNKQTNKYAEIVHILENYGTKSCKEAFLSSGDAVAVVSTSENPL
ncbi:hypothetical protein C9J27_04940 [Photobacterium kishitanii]|uniref:Uncharacterized protein n=2 Tax=Photobacterium kishitanii TaxID=318456 RepID=A0A2T3KL99_9GAMM|nr:hypothetical protein C9J27_04940 [Photobacterium kishitanii]